MLDTLLCILIKFLNLIIEYGLDLILEALAWCFDLLPNLPILPESIEWGDFGLAVAYFLPVVQMITHFELMLTLFAVWYAIQTVFRWVKQIQ